MKKLLLFITLIIMAAATHLRAASLSVENLIIPSGQNGQLAVSMTNTETNLSGFQFRLYLPEGLSIATNDKGKFQYMLGDRIANHSLTIRALDDGGYQFIAYSMDGDAITGTSGVLLSVPVVPAENFTSGNGTISDIRLTDLDANKTTCSNVSFTITKQAIPATGITLSQSVLSFNAVNQSATLTATVTPANATIKSVTWTSSNTNVATVNSTGVVTAIADGTATITATTSDGTNLSATCAVTVGTSVPATGITLSQSAVSFTAANQTATLTATVTPANATNKSVTWTSSNTNVATVSSTGVVTAIADGTATITATTSDGTNLSASCAVTVAPPFSGDYYIMNVETDLFLGGQNLWGVQATLSEDAGIFQFVPGTTGEGYNIKNTLVSASNKNLGTNLYTDNNGLATVKDDEAAGITKMVDGIWTIEPQGGGIFAFKCVSEWKWENDAWVEIPHGYLCKSETAGYRKGYELKFSQELTDNCLFRVMTYDEAKEYMIDKAQSSNVSFNFLIKNPDFCRSNSTAAWTVSADCTNKNLAGGDNNNMCAESWRSTFTISQIVKDLPAGRYQLSAQGFYQRYDSNTDPEPYVFAGETKVTLPDRDAIDASVDNMTKASQAFTAGKFMIDPVRFNLTEKTDLEIGFHCGSNKYWCIWDNIQLMSYSNVKEYGDEILAGITYPYEPDALASTDVRAAYNQAYSDFSSFVANITPGVTTFDDVDEEYAKFAAAETALKASIASWSNYTVVAEKAKSLYTQITSQEGKYNPNTALNALNSYANGAPITPGESASGYTFVNGNYAYIKANPTLNDEQIGAEIEFVNSLMNDVKKKSVKDGMDVTFLLVNADFKDTNVGYGWTRQNSGSVNWNIRSGLSGWPVSEAYIPANGSTFDIFQVVEGAPAGLYKVTVNAFHRPAGTWDAETKVPVALYMGTIANPIQNIAKDPIINDLVWSDEEQKYLDGEVAKNGTNCYFWDGNSAKDDAAKAAIWAGNQNPDPEIQALISGSTSLTGAGKYNSDSQYNESYLIPNGMDGASIAFSAGRYPMVVYGEVPDEGDGVGTLRIGLKSLEPLDAGAWTLFGGFKLERVDSQNYATSIALDRTSAALTPGAKEQLTATVLPEGATDKTVTWTSSDPTVATVDENGLVTAVAAGAATITATTNDGTSLEASCAVTVVVPAASIALNKTETAIAVEAQEQLTVTVLPEDATDKTVTWTSSDPSVATVDENGLVTAVGNGTATITATTNDGTNLTATCEVTVETPISSYLTLTDVSGLIGARCVLPISMSNTESIKGLQFDLRLPDGVTVATNEYDEMMFTLTSRAHSSHAVSANRLGNGDYRVVVSSLSAKTFSGTEGVIMNVTLSVDNNQVAGDYEVKLFSIVLNTADNVSIKPNGMTATLSLSDVAPGDVNGDGSINVTDVGMVIDHILEHTPAGFIAEAADINGDGDINVTDVGLIIDIILSDNSAREVLMKENVKKSVEEIHEPQ